MRKQLALVVSAAVLSGWGAQSAQAATTTTKAANRSAANITAVEIAWTDNTNSKIRITWSESTPVANKLLLLTNGSAPGEEFGATPAAGPNELVVDKAVFKYSTDRATQLQIVVRDAASVDEARSLQFDNFIRVSEPTLYFDVNGALRWQLWPDNLGDPNPGDPLDRVNNYRYVPRQRVYQDPAPDPGCRPVQHPATTTPTGVIPHHGGPSTLTIDIINEWATVPANGWIATTLAAPLAAPTSTPYGTMTKLVATVSDRVLFESGRPPTCEELTVPPVSGSETISLQARTSSSAAWTVVATTTTDQNGKGTFSFVNRGMREYRMLRENREEGIRAVYGGVSAGKVVRASTRVMSAKFINPVINYGTKPQAYLWVEPAGTQKAALQFKNTSGAWQGVQYKTLYAGRGLLTFPWNRRGITQFRWWIPAHGGADATYTGPFTLEVR